MEVDSQQTTSNNRDSEIPCSLATYEEFCDWATEDQLAREEGHILPPSSPTQSEESVTSPILYDIDPESPLGLLLQHC